MSENPQDADLRPFSITFRLPESGPHLDAEIYRATAETLAQLARDFVDGNTASGVYQVVDARVLEPRTLAVLFKDVLYIG